MKNDNKVLKKIFFNSLTYYIMADLTTVVGPLVDSIIIANYFGVNAVAAVGLFAPSLMLVSIIENMVVGGGRWLYTHLVENGEFEKANFVFTLSCILVIPISLFITVFGIIFASNIATFLGANEVLRPYLVAYIRGYLPGIVFFSIAKVINGFMSFEQDGNRPLLSLITMTVVNVVGDLFVVFVMKGSLFWVAIATSIGNLSCFLVLSGYFLRTERLFRFNFCEIKNVVKYTKDIFSMGSNTAVAHFSRMFSDLTVNYMLVAYASAVAIAAYSIQKSLMSLLGCVYLGVADTVWLMSGIFYGEEDREALDELQVHATKVGLKISIIVGIIVFIFSKYIAGLYIGFSDIEALRCGTESVKMFAITLPIYVIVYSFDNYLISVKRIYHSNIYSFIMYFGTVVPTAFVLIKIIGPRGSWISTPIAALLSLIIAGILIYTYKTNSNLFNIKRLLVPIEFGNYDGKVIEITADTVVEISGMSRIAGLFCQENNIDSVVANKLALCIEEIGTNIIEHGFKDGKDHEINMRIAVKEKEIILRIRDDCVPFNPIERYKMKTKNDKDPTKNIGIRMVTGLCSSVNYICTYSTNNLIMKIAIV